MARPHDSTALSAHPAIGAVYKKMLKYGWTTLVAPVTCPHCGTIRQVPLYTLRQQMKRPDFSGRCKPCLLEFARLGAARYQYKTHKGRKRKHHSGYVLLGPNSVEACDVQLFRSMQNRSNTVFEHRLVMAKHLGRPLKRNENVDHMDGNRANNALANLRLYVKGKNQPGSCPGYGTYYNEWQMALVEIAGLKR